MQPVGPRLLIQIIAKHPWSSLRDALVLTGVMTLAVLIALHYDLFEFIAALADPQYGISPAEAVLLAAMLGIGIYLFVGRRLKEERWDDASQERLHREMSELRELAMQDPLTLLPNRRALLSALEAATEVCGPGCPQHAVFLLDLNDFKRVNDRFGHAVGDHVLQVVVERFRRVTRPSDLLARLGGDEFAVLSYDIDKARGAGDRRALRRRLEERHRRRRAPARRRCLDRRGAVSRRRRDQGHDPAPRRPRHVPGEGRGKLLGRILRPGDRRGAAGARGRGLSDDST